MDYLWHLCTSPHPPGNGHLMEGVQIILYTVHSCSAFHATLRSHAYPQSGFGLQTRDTIINNGQVCNYCELSSLPSTAMLLHYDHGRTDQNVTDLLWTACKKFNLSQNSSVRSRSFHKRLVMLPFPIQAFHEAYQRCFGILLGHIAPWLLPECFIPRVCNRLWLCTAEPNQNDWVLCVYIFHKLFARCCTLPDVLFLRRPCQRCTAALQPPTSSARIGCAKWCMDSPWWVPVNIIKSAIDVDEVGSFISAMH